MWSESITDSCKEDVLVLFGLNLLTETHCVEHLANGQIWTTLAMLSGVHSTDLQKCDLHLAYIGRGLFIELTEHAVPLMIAEATESTTSLVIGELSASEECTIDDVMETGLGIGLAHATSKESHTTKHTPSASAAKKEDLPQVESELKETSFKDSTPYTPPVAMDSTYKPTLHLVMDGKVGTVPTLPNGTPDTVVPKTKEFTINLLKLTLELGEMFHISNELLATYPLSRFRPPGYYPIMTQDVDKESFNSDTTEIYWSIDSENVPDQDQSSANNKIM